MMLPTLLVVPGVYLKSDMVQNPSVLVTPGFWLKSTNFYQSNGQFHGPRFKPPVPFLERHFLCYLLCDPVYCSNARKTVKNEAGET